ncbi:MAG: hypothetical protein AB7H92_09545 [Microbacteriaceae bacterium]
MSVPAPAHVDGVAALHRALADRALEPAPTPEDRERAITALLELAGARREPLEVVRGEFQHRLARRSDDFDATHALRLVEGALAQATRPDGPWGWASRERRERRGRRRRGR